MKPIINCLILALFSLTALAQEPAKEPATWYEVEIILFENLNPVSRDSEQWPVDVEQPDLSEAVHLLRSPVAREPAIELTDVAVETTPVIDTPETEAVKTDSPPAAEENVKDPYLDTPYLILPAEQYQLNHAYQKLLDSEDYLPLVHVAWRQIVPPRDQPDRIFIHDKLNEVIEENMDAALVDETLPAIDLEIPASNIEVPPEILPEESLVVVDEPKYALSGIISLGLGRYLHVDTDLVLYRPQLDNIMIDDALVPPPPPFSETDAAPFVFNAELEPAFEELQAPELFRIQGNLRMRSKEVHYLDHPLVGMLILFTPYTPPEVEVVEEAEVPIIEEQVLPEENPKKGVIIRPGHEKEDRSF